MCYILIFLHSGAQFASYHLWYVHNDPWLARKHKIKQKQVPMDEKSFWSISFSCCIQNFKTPFSVVWGMKSSNFSTEMGDRMMKHLNWLAAVHCTEFDKYVFSALHGPFNDSKHGKQKKHGPSFACSWWWRYHCCPCKMKKRPFLILLEPFRVIVVLNHFEGL